MGTHGSNGEPFQGNPRLQEMHDPESEQIKAWKGVVMLPGSVCGWHFIAGKQGPPCQPSSLTSYPSTVSRTDSRCCRAAFGILCSALISERYLFLNICHQCAQGHLPFLRPLFSAWLGQVYEAAPPPPHTVSPTERSAQCGTDEGSAADSHFSSKC